jgi:hypothetical protein
LSPRLILHRDVSQFMRKHGRRGCTRAQPVSDQMPLALMRPRQ